MTALARTQPAAPAASTTRRGGRSRRRIGSVLAGAAGIVVFFASVFPVYWMVNTSFQPNAQVRGTQLHFWPDNGTVENYVGVIFHNERAPFLPALLNSLQVTLLTVAVALVFAFLAALAVTRFRFRSRAAFIITILLVQMIPAEAMIISTFRLIDGWALLNTVVGLSAVYIATVLPFTIWTLRGFVNGVPVELEEAAMIDGLSRAQAFWRITFPLLAPGLVATGVFGFIQAWNEFVFALVLNPRPESMTLPVWLRTFLDPNGGTNWAELMAGSTLVAIPVVIFFLIVQGRMTSGLVAGAVKG
ncbi:MULTISPECIES: carbohydrate ABC transporter permease [unclassified Microbacterium]|uniref:carbohydrate ABC transporter permease n=1 Tax=unclassified Microbacterium TaxID=2609290 RepID=UPI00214B810F|nr:MULTISPECIES: carbohydrate ABC transporter permease [unclassified Microbacterium]MCR2810483.1 carbohydrate ABC transporter permease [Microbacterium sp. zg.B185]WIM18534.1 carbohydrate ABC transporter permease [Microbacterium sp. zg-B185]